MARPATAGFAMPQKLGTDRVGCGRVRMGGRA
jgi:hypothetical protein